MDNQMISDGSNILDYSSRLEVKVRTAIEHINHPGFMLFAPCPFPQALFGYGLRCGVD
jgi:hypothetical protein